MFHRSNQFSTLFVNDNRILWIYLAGKYHSRSKGIDMFCQISLQWTCTVCRFVSMFDNITLGSIGKMNRKFLVFKTFVDIGKHKLNNASDIVFGKRFKHDNLIKTIQKLLMQIGIPANMLGFSYIVTALELIALDPDYLNHITKGLYVDVAKKCSSTAARVERNIRHAIEIGFLKGDLEEIEKIFHCSSYSDKGAPTNSKFLAEVYYYMVNNEL